MAERDLDMTETEDRLQDEPAPKRKLSAVAKRALAEAEERRRAAREQARRAEIGGRGGLDPARYGDWEIKGRAIDF